MTKITPDELSTLATLRQAFVEEAKARCLEKDKPETLLTAEMQAVALKAYDWLITEFKAAYPDVRPGEEVTHLVVSRIQAVELRAWSKIEEQPGVGELSGPLFGWIATRAAEDFFKATEKRMPLSQVSVSFLHRFGQYHRNDHRDSSPKPGRG